MFHSFSFLTQTLILFALFSTSVIKCSWFWCFPRKELHPIEAHAYQILKEAIDAEVAKNGPNPITHEEENDILKEAVYLILQKKLTQKKPYPYDKAMQLLSQRGAAAHAQELAQSSRAHTAIARGEPVIITDPFPSGILHYAIYHGAISTVAALLAAGANPNELVPHSCAVPIDHWIVTEEGEIISDHVAFEVVPLDIVRQRIFTALINPTQKNIIPIQLAHKELLLKYGAQPSDSSPYNRCMVPRLERQSLSLHETLPHRQYSISAARASCLEPIAEEEEGVVVVGEDEVAEQIFIDTELGNCLIAEV